MVIFEWVESNHLCYGVALRFENLLLQAKDRCGVFRNVDAPSLYGHQKFSFLYEIHVDVFRKNSCLIGLGNIGIDGINGLDNAPISSRKSGISKYRGHVAPIFRCVVNEVSK